jgi:hypothetical protein
MFSQVMEMDTVIRYLIPLLLMAILLDLLFVRRLQKYRRLKTEATDKDGNLTVSKRDLLLQAFFEVKEKKDNMLQSRIDSFSQKLTASQLTIFALEWLLIIVIAYFYCGDALLDLDPSKLQQTGEHNASATLPLLAEIGLNRNGEIPLWNPYMLTGFPHNGDPLGHFWNPVSTIPIMIWGGINGMKISIFLSFIIAGLGQWMFAYVMRLRRVFRLWSAILFMLSGGLALLWRVGWYELLLGAVWFPWAFALFIHALRKHSLSSIFCMSIALYMIISTGGGYYPFYLAACLITLFLVMFIPATRQERFRQVQTSLFILVCTAALAAVILLPYSEVYRAYGRDVHVDLQQQYSQPIEYGLLNFVIYTRDWFNESVLGTAGGWNWFYIGWLPIAALAFIPLAFARSPRARGPIVISGILFILLMMWFANRFTPFEKVFDWMPFLYNLRFPNRLLIIAASPLLILAAIGLEHAYRTSKALVRNFRLVHSAGGRKRTVIFAHLIIIWVWVIGLISLTRSAYTVNQDFGFVDQSFNPKPMAALSWLKKYDNSLYYVNIGGGAIYWDWVAAAYDLEVPVINFLYSRHLRTQDMQRSDYSPFVAQAKYQISLPAEAAPANAVQIREFDGVLLWKVPDVLPYAFSVHPNLVQQYTKLAADQVGSINVRLNGPNQVIAKGAPASDGDVLVVLMSHFPGWKLLIDGRPAEVLPINGYLGARMLPGVHTYQFYFLPTSFMVGSIISAMSWLALIAVLIAAPVRSLMQRLARPRAPVISPNVTT